MENDWPEEKMDLAKHQVISMPKGSRRVYHKGQITTDQRSQKVIKLVQIYKNVYNAIRGQTGHLSLSLPHNGSSKS